MMPVLDIELKHYSYPQQSAIGQLQARAQSLVSINEKVSFYECTPRLTNSSNYVLELVYSIDHVVRLPRHAIHDSP